MAEDILVAKKIYKHYGGVEALSNVSMTIKSGEIHCLVGENGSGKSTFVKIISGAVTPDYAEITLNGRLYHHLTPIQAIHEGIQVIYQDLSLFPHMSVAENIAINKLVAEGHKFIDRKMVESIAEHELHRLGVDIDLYAPVETLSLANRQIVAICRALSLNAKLLFMDEPTTALPTTEVKYLLDIILELKQKGYSVVFISHKLNEVFEVADVITIFRDGKKVGDFKSDELTYESLVFHMTGRSVEYPRFVRKIDDNSTAFEVRNLSKAGQYEDISFELRKGDILGITGLRGCGRDELVLSLFGLNPPDKGDILINGRKVAINTPVDAVNEGISLVPEDRIIQALFPTHSIADNITAPLVNKLTTKIGLFDDKAHNEKSKQMVKEFRIRTPNVELEVQNLSGGNQQKTVISRWMLTQPKVLILNGPTVGVDIGSKAEIYEKIQEIANQGVCIILVSDELAEILANCNKVIVMNSRRVVGFLTNEEIEKPEAADQIQHLMSDELFNNQNNNINIMVGEVAS